MVAHVKMLLEYIRKDKLTIGKVGEREVSHCEKEREWEGEGRGRRTRRKRREEETRNGKGGREKGYTW